VYSPALVAFIGGASFSVGISAGPAVAWFPLGYREPYIPWYDAARTYVRNVNVAYVTHVTNITNVTNVRYVNRLYRTRSRLFSRETFVGARPVQREVIRVPTLAGSPRRRSAARHRLPRPPGPALRGPSPRQRPPAQLHRA
jgi:hypothetical protein